MAETHTDKRIIKLARKGLTPTQIARKIGRPGDTERVWAALKRLELHGFTDYIRAITRDNRKHK